MGKEVLVYVARHGTTALNGTNVFRGTRDMPLDANGLRDAHQLAHYFEPIEVSHIVCSNMRRAIVTAKIIAEAKGSPVHQTPNLRPREIGEFTGLEKTEENMAQWRYYIDHPDASIPGGESLNEFQSRLRPCIMEAIELAGVCGEPVLMVMHSSGIHEIGSVLYHDYRAALVEPGGVAVIYTENGQLGAEPIFRPKPVEAMSERPAYT